MPRGCRPSSVASSSPFRRRSLNLVKTPISTAVRRTLEFQKPNAVCRIAEGSRGVFIGRSMLDSVEGRNLALSKVSELSAMFVVVLGIDLARGNSGDLF